MTPPENTQVFETPLLRCWFGEDGILFSISKPGERTIENYKGVFELYQKLSENGRKKIYTLGNITDTQPLSREVREYVSIETSKYLNAMALVADSALGKAIGTSFEVLSPISYPVFLFNKVEDAISWLRQKKTEKEELENRTR